MDRNPELGPSFYKFLVNDDFTSKLRIPTEFVNKYGELLHPKMTLKTDYLSGKLWNVGIEQVGQRHFSVEGWSKFAEDVDLKHQEYLIFKFVGESTFGFSVYEVTGCKEESCSAGVPRNLSAKVKTEDNQETWKFTKELKSRYSMKRLEFPRGFATDTGIATNLKITLQDAKGRKWPVKVTDRSIGVYGLTAGLKDFLKLGNNVAIGSVISFEFIPNSDNIMEALVIKNAIGKVHFPAKAKIEDNQETWKFTKKLKKHHSMRCLDFPRLFARGTGIAKNRKITLKDAKGRKWPVNVTDRNMGTYAMTGGWKDFLRGNNVAIGSVISYEFIPNSVNIIEALVIKNGIGKEHSIPAKRGRGRPPLRRTS